eukprot:scaffold33879_cov20-Prasinocladus_malaysianus.AAC.1
MSGIGLSTCLSLSPVAGHSNGSGAKKWKKLQRQRLLPGRYASPGHTHMQHQAINALNYGAGQGDFAGAASSKHDPRRMACRWLWLGTYHEVKQHACGLCMVCSSAPCRAAEGPGA